MYFFRYRKFFKSFILNFFCLVPENLTINTPRVLSLVKYGKLTERKVRYIVRHKMRGKSNKEIAFELRVSVSTVKRVWSYWLSHHEYLPIKDRGRPRVRDLSMREKEIIKEAKKKYKLGARRLEKIIDQVYGVHIPHNRIHRYLLEEGLAGEEPKKKRRRKPYVRYEREHSMSAGHIDWYNGGVKLCAILDDASRKVLVAGEFQHADTDNSITIVDQMVEDYWGLLPLRELIMDNGSAFGAHRRNGEGEWDSRFKRHIESLGIKPIPTREKHPQTNGKIEKFFDCYNKYRHEFDSLEEFVDWYNNVRFHESLDTKWYLQTPEEAFWGRLPEEVKVGIPSELFEW